MSTVNEFLNETGTFFLATVDGDAPKCRPLGLHVCVDGMLLFGVGDFKAVYRQLRANPKAEIVALKPDGKWLRYSGEAVFMEDEKYAAAALETSPYLKNIYNEQTGHKLMMFRLENACARVINVMGEGEAIEV